MKDGLTKSDACPRLDVSRGVDFLFLFFFTFPVLGWRKGILYRAPPQHFFFTGGEVIGGVSNLAVVTRPWTGKLSRPLLDRNTLGSTNKALMGLFGYELLIWRVWVQEAHLMLT